MVTRELAEELKKACEEQECETCPFSVGIYMEGLDYVYYSCDIRKKPRDYDIEKIRMKQTKGSKKSDTAEKKPKKKTKTTKEPTTEKKKRGRKKKEDK